ncbi:MAG TPA: MarR family transcriptional regulator [Acidimicrobiia bacterium]|nr:MarR family transcriptional regulator [Acidimicrobiia bacterium]
MTRVTKGELAGEVWEQIASLFFAHSKSHLEVARELGLTPGHTKTLFELDEHDGKPMGELANAMACDASNATWLVDRLEERGLVERRPYPGDRRVKAVVLTEQGAKLRAQLIERMATPPEDLVALDREDLEALHAALDRLPHHPPFWAPSEKSAARD